MTAAQIDRAIRGRLERGAHSQDALAEQLGDAISAEALEASLARLVRDRHIEMRMKRVRGKLRFVYQLQRQRRFEFGGTL